MRRTAIETVRATRPFVIDAWVLLPDHLYCIWTLPDGMPIFDTLDDDQAPRIFGMQGGLSSRGLDDGSKRKHGESTIWQRRFWEHRIRDEEDCIWHADYIHFNPVKHGNVQWTAEWPYSTFHRFVRAGIYAVDWLGSAPVVGVDYE